MNMDGDADEGLDGGDPPSADNLRIIADMLNQIESAIVMGENDLELQSEQFSGNELGLEYWSRHLGNVIRENQ